MSWYSYGMDSEAPRIPWCQPLGVLNNCCSLLFVSVLTFGWGAHQYLVVKHTSLNVWTLHICYCELNTHTLSHKTGAHRGQNWLYVVFPFPWNKKAVNQTLEVDKAQFVITIESVAFIVTELVSIPGEGEGAECLFF